jgi:hypothetical protein
MPSAEPRHVYAVDSNGAEISKAKNVEFVTTRGQRFGMAFDPTLLTVGRTGDD